MRGLGRERRRRPTTSRSLAGVPIRGSVLAAARVRGVAVGAVSTSLAAAAHAVAGGMLPDAPGLLLLAGLGPVLACAATTLPGLRSGRWGLFGLLGAGQLAGHLVLGVTAQHAAMVAPSDAMVAGHALAVGLATLLVLGAERVGGRCVAALRRALPAREEHHRPPPTVPHVAVRVATTALFSVLLTTSQRRRGPPLVA